MLDIIAIIIFIAGVTCILWYFPVPTYPSTTRIDALEDEIKRLDLWLYNTELSAKGVHKSIKMISDEMGIEFYFDTDLREIILRKKEQINTK